MESGFLPDLFEANVQLQFGECTLDTDTREIFRGGRSVHLEPKAYRLLELLLESRPKALSKGDLQDALWPDTYVSELALSRLVSVLRGALGDATSKPRLIRTVHGFGYAFAAEVIRVKAIVNARSGQDVHFHLRRGGRDVALEEGENLIGRDTSCSVRIDKKSVSRRHARVLVADGVATIEDLGSRNGTFVDEKRIEGRTRLADGSRIKIGGAKLVVRALRGLGSTQSEASSEIG